MSSCLAQSFLNYKLISPGKKNDFFIFTITLKSTKERTVKALSTAPTSSPSPDATVPGGVLPIKFGQNNCIRFLGYKGDMISSEDSCKYYVQGLRYLGLCWNYQHASHHHPFKPHTRSLTAALNLGGTAFYLQWTIVLFPCSSTTLPIEKLFVAGSHRAHNALQLSRTPKLVLIFLPLPPKLLWVTNSANTCLATYHGPMHTPQTYIQQKLQES